MKIDYQARIKRLQAAAEADVIVLVPGANMIYYTGLHYHLSERPTLAFISAEGLSFIMPELEMSKLQQRPDLEAQAFAWSDTNGYSASFDAAVKALKLGGRQVAVDGMVMRVFEWMALQRAGVQPEKASDVGQLLLRQRAIKESYEIEAMRRANELSETALQKTLATVHPGMTERQIAARLSEELSAAGSSGHAFDPLVLTGPNSALPHGNTSDRVWQEDEFLLIDYGGCFGDYPADITRTFCMGAPSDEMRRIYDAVYRANAAARAVAGPGVPCGVVDKAARDVIEAAGYGPYFTHRTGHGLGLEGHELPQIASGVETLLEVGMVFTIEPGIYLPDVGGVRIEDDMVVTENGAESLTSYPREL